MRVAVCIATYRRPEGLRRLLEGLDRLRFAKVPPPAVEIVVVDNDPAGSACALLESVKLVCNWPLRCYVEPRRGIPYARNRAIVSVEGRVDFVAFVDDDEIPAPEWLDELLHVQRSYDADVVAGRVLQCFDKEVPDWVLKGKFFEQYRHPTGQRLRGVYVATNNVLIRTSVLKDMGEEVFDERFALSGGSDTHLFMRIEKAEYKMVWADDAVVRDWVPKSRANARWILQRAYRLGNTLSLCERDLRPSIVVRAARVAKSAKQFLQGFLLLPVSVVLGWHLFIRALQHFFRGMGMVMGIAGVRYEEYRKTHGT